MYGFAIFIHYEMITFVKLYLLLHLLPVWGVVKTIKSILRKYQLYDTVLFILYITLLIF